MTEQCSNCKCYSDANGMRGQCRARSPVIVPGIWNGVAATGSFGDVQISPDTNGVFPWVSSGDWCKEWTSKK